jgi:PAS domain S-box-containing protein
MEFLKQILLCGRKQAEAAADSSEKAAMLTDIINNTVDGMIVIDEQGIMQMFNPACEKIFGYKAEEVIGKNIKILMPEPYKSEHDGYLGSYLRTGQAKVIGIDRELRGQHKDGMSFPLELSVSEIKLRNKRLFSGVVRDISKRKSVEDQLQTYMVEMEWFRNEAEKATRMKSEFLAMMSHEIRTPMNGVLGMTELLLETGLNGQQARYAKTAMRSAHNLLGIINDILDFSKIEAGRMVLEPLPMDLRKLSQEAIELFSVRAHEKSLELLLHYPDGAPQYVLGDAGRIHQIVSNLLSNAIKFTDKGRVELIVAWLADGKIKISIKDTGIGIPEDAQAGLFNKFTQADTSTTRKYGGTGLGLAICRQLAALMGGEVGIESAPGAGSTFWFTMHLPAADENDLPAPEKDIIGQPEILKGLKILLTEDNPINQEFALEILRQFGCQATLAINGRLAVDFVTGKDTYDLILMDCQMPEMDGYDATRHIREYFRQNSLQRIPIIAMTANAMKQDQEKCLAAGMDDHLAKPFLKKELAAMLMKWLHGAAAPGRPNSPQLTKRGQDWEINRAALDGIKDLMGERYQEIVQKYVSNTDAMILKMARTFEGSKNPAEIALEAHSLKSSSSYLGDVMVNLAAKDLEAAAKTAPSTEDLRQGFETLQTAWQNIRPVYVRELNS